MKAREVVLAILIILAGIFITEVKTGRLVWDWDAGDFIFDRGEEFVFEETQEIGAPLPAELEILNAHGTVVVEGGETPTMTVRFKKRIYRKTREDAQDIADRLTMVVNRTDPRLVLSTNRDEFRRRPFETDFKVSVPLGTSVLIKNSYGLVQAGGTGRTEISNPHGEVIAASVRGELVLDTSYESVAVDDVQGDVRLTCPHGDVFVKNVQGELVVDHSYGQVRLEDVAKKLTVNGRNSKVLAKNLGGEAEIRSSYEPVTVTQAGAVTVRGHHNAITITDATGKCDITNEYGTVRIDNLTGDLKVDGRNTAVFGRLVRAGVLTVVTTYDKVELVGFSGSASVNISHAPLVLEPESISGPLNVQGSHADIRLVWPAGARHPFEAETRQGSIFWGLADRPSVESTNGISITKAYLDATGQPAVTIKTAYGDIRVEESPRRAA